MTLLKDKHPQKDLFIPDIFDNIGASFKDDMASMEHPIFTLSKKTDMRFLEYKNGDLTVSIIPSGLGLPTIFDKDVLLYCMSLMMAEINVGRIPPKTLRISCRDFLVSTNRRTDGDDYIRLKQALDRLTGVLIKTNIKTNKREQTSAFGILESYDIIESSKVKNRMVRLEITVSDWFYNSVIGKEVLTISRDYFLLGKPIERRLYEIARKHCGSSPQWKIGLDKLMQKTGSSDTLRKFRLRLKEIAQDNHLPDYSFSLDEHDQVTFSQKRQKPQEESFLPFLDRSILGKIKFDTVFKAKEIARKAGLDFEEIIKQWGEFMEKNGTPDNINAAMIGFMKKKAKAL